MWYDLVLGAEGRKEVLCPLPSQRFNQSEAQEDDCSHLPPSAGNSGRSKEVIWGRTERNQGSCTALLSGARTISWGAEWS